MIDYIGLVHVKTENEQSGPIYVRSVMKTIQNNDVVDRTGAIYTKNETKLSWLIGLGMIYAETETELLGPIWSGVVNEEAIEQ